MLLISEIVKRKTSRLESDIKVEGGTWEGKDSKITLA